jgi:hypothetical protein
MNKDLDGVSKKIMQVFKFISDNEVILNEKPYIRVKMARLKRILIASHQGIERSILKPKMEQLKDMDLD